MHYYGFLLNYCPVLQTSEFRAASMKLLGFCVACKISNLHRNQGKHEKMFPDNKVRLDHAETELIKSEIILGSAGDREIYYTYSLCPKK